MKRIPLATPEEAEQGWRLSHEFLLAITEQLAAKLRIVRPEAVEDVLLVARHYTGVCVTADDPVTAAEVAFLHAHAMLDVRRLKNLRKGLYCTHRYLNGGAACFEYFLIRSWPDKWCENCRERQRLTRMIRSRAAVQGNLLRRFKEKTGRD